MQPDSPVWYPVYMLGMWKIANTGDSAYRNTEADAFGAKNMAWMLLGKVPQTDSEHAHIANYVYLVAFIDGSSSIRVGNEFFEQYDWIQSKSTTKGISLLLETS